MQIKTEKDDMKKFFPSEQAIERAVTEAEKTLEILKLESEGKSLKISEKER